MEVNCLFCGSNINLVFLHGHYQCPVCKTNALPCCDGDNCDNSSVPQSNISDEKEVTAGNRSYDNISNKKKQQNQQYPHLTNINCS